MIKPKDSYYQNNVNDVTYSYSLAKTISPDFNGHPKLFKKILEEGSQPTKFTELGELIHKYLEDPDSFVAAELDLPPTQFAAMTEELYKIYHLEGYKDDNRFASYISPTLDIAEWDLVGVLYTNIKGFKPNQEELFHFAKCLYFSRQSVELDKRLKPATIIEKFQLCLPYYQFLVKATGKLVLSASDKNHLANVKEAIKNDSRLTDVLTYNAEEELYWQESYEVEVSNSAIVNHTIKRKGKVDRYKITEIPIETPEGEEPKFKLKLSIRDFKTTSKPIGGYLSYIYESNMIIQLINYAVGIYYSKIKTNDRYKDIKIEEIEYDLGFIVIELDNNYPISIFKLEQDYYNFVYHFNDYKSLFKKVCFHEITGNYDITMEEQLNTEKVILI